MVKTCCVKNCDIAPKENVACFRFPNNRLLKRKWIDAIGLSNKLTANSTVCIKHFQEDDYDIVRGRPRLKAKVIPSVFGEADRQLVLSSSSSEDGCLLNEINTEITLKNIQKEEFNLSGLRTVLYNEAQLETKNKNSEQVQNENKTKIGNDLQNESSTNVLIEGSSTLQNEDSMTLKNEGSATLQNEDSITLQTEGISTLQNESSTTLQNGDRTTLQNEGSTVLDNEKSTTLHNEGNTSLHNEDTTERHNGGKTDSQNVDRPGVQDESTDRILKESKNEIQNEDSPKLKDDSSTQDIGKCLTDSQKSRKNKANGVLLKKKKNEKDYQDSFIESTTKSSNNGEDLNKDIEDIIVNYQIKQTRPVHTAEVESIPLEENGLEDDEGFLKENDPVFIEVAVQGDKAGSPRDCLMVLESVQVELDPSTFLADGEPDDCHETVDLADDDDDGLDQNPGRRPDPISLLTSSDEDEVIIQEPHIDTVEVSDETDEDDVPLVKLLKKPKKKKKPKIAIWNTYEYFCMDCQFTASTRQEYRAHTAKHSTILQVCEICDYTTASKSQFSRHKKKHKDDRKFKCHLCDYKARHNMSLIYHLKSHRALSSAKKGFKCDKCGFQSDVKSVVVKHVKLCSSNVKKYSCNKCVYETKRASDLRRHRARRHKNNEEDDEEFVP